MKFQRKRVLSCGWYITQWNEQNTRKKEGNKLSKKFHRKKGDVGMKNRQGNKVHVGILLTGSKGKETR